MRDDEKAIANWLRRSAAACIELAYNYDLLADMVAAGGGVRDESGVGGSSVEAALPVRAEVIDLRTDIAAAAARYAALARGTLRTGAEVTGTVGARLRFVSGVLPRLWLADPDLTTEAVDALWGFRNASEGVVNPTRRTKPFRIPDNCPVCAIPSLWVDPRSWRVACGMDGCLRVWGIHEPVLVHASGGGR